jgi:hypothetical protein
VPPAHSSTPQLGRDRSRLALVGRILRLVIASPGVTRGRVIIAGCALAAGILSFATASAVPDSALASGAWSIESTPNTGAAFSYLNGVSCPDASTCTAAGYYLIGSPGFTPLVERWSTSSETWSLQTVPNENQGMVLRGVSCASDTSCVAVGQRVTFIPISSPKPPHVRVQWWTAAEQLNDGTWSIQNPSYTGTLDSVSCPATSFCTTVGQTGGAVAEQWTGTTWTVQTSNQLPALLGVSCPSTTECVAVGTTNPATPTQAVMAQWDESSGTWTFQTSGGELSAVSCPTTTDCIAVGNSVNSAGVQQTLAEQWNGNTNTWSIEQPPQPSGATSSALTGVSCTSPTACTAVGNFVNSAGAQRMLAEQWNGNNWSAPSLPPVPSGATSSTLSSVSCTSATTCTAVGDYVDSSGIETLAESYGG